MWQKNKEFIYLNAKWFWLCDTMRKSEIALWTHLLHALNRKQRRGRQLSRKSLHFFFKFVLKYLQIYGENFLCYLWVALHDHCSNHVVCSAVRKPIGSNAELALAQNVARPKNTHFTLHNTRGLWQNADYLLLSGWQFAFLILTCSCLQRLK